MASSDRADSPLDAASSTAGPQATEAFKLVSNETRLAILLALWEAYDPYGEESAVSFSALRERVGLRHGEQFNYHLGELQGYFVEKTDGGYELSRIGRLLVQRIISGTGIEESSFERTEIDASCERCGAPTAIAYENSYVYQVCTECDGKSEPDDDHPSGMLRGLTFDPAGIADRTAEGLFEASWLKSFGRLLMRFEGVCPECSGPVEWTVDGCGSHDAGDDGACQNCGRNDPVWSREICTVCKSWAEGTPGYKLLFHPAVVSFYYDRGVELGFTGDTDYVTLLRMLTIVEELDQTVEQTDPLRVRVTFSHDGDELRLLLDDTLTVVGVEQGE